MVIYAPQLESQGIEAVTYYRDSKPEAFAYAKSLSLATVVDLDAFRARARAERWRKIELPP